MTIKTPITVAHGDGIGPEIMEATLRILDAAGAALDIETIEVGEQVFLAGNTTGIPEEAWQSLERTKILLKAPITTPQGKGYKSLNVTIRKTLGLYANVRPCVSLHPFVETYFPDMDVVIVRENEEDLYSGIEHRQTQNVYQCLKLISRQGSERIVNYAFEYARKFNRKKVACFVKDNIMKMTDGVFHDVFREIAKSYPDIESESYIVDIGTALLASNPEKFDVIVTENLYGDIISDVAAQVVGSVGLAGSANIGDDVAMFEAIHGSAPDIAGRNIANPSGLLNGAIQMLIHINQPKVAAAIHNAWLKTLEDGMHTADIFKPNHSQHKVGTAEFADALIERLGQSPSKFTPVDYGEVSSETHVTCVGEKPTSQVAKTLVGVDVFLDAISYEAQALGEALRTIDCGVLHLHMIATRGLTVWPKRLSRPMFGEHWRCRYLVSKDYESVTHQDIILVLKALSDAGFDVIKTENLYLFDGERGFSLGQGE